MKPMLAATIEDRGSLEFPLIASPKLDGVRALVIDGVVVSRNFKPIPNKWVQECFGRPEYNGLDGELIVPPHDGSVFTRTTSAVMSIEGKPYVEFAVFDNILMDGYVYEDRYDSLPMTVIDNLNRIWRVESVWVKRLSQLNRLEIRYLKRGFEGVMLRKPGSPYKYGRSTLREGGLMKLKRFVDSEAEIIGFMPWRQNTNASEINELGYKQKSTKKEGMVELDMLGAFQVRDLVTGVEFEIGTGFTHEDRKDYWQKREPLLGQVVKYKHQPTGAKDKPRFPVFLGFRHPIDM